MRQLILCAGSHLGFCSRRSYFPLPIILLKHETFYPPAFFFLQNLRACTGLTLSTLHAFFSNSSSPDMRERGKKKVRKWWRNEALRNLRAFVRMWVFCFDYILYTYTTKNYTSKSHTEWQKRTVGIWSETSMTSWALCQHSCTHTLGVMSENTLGDNWIPACKLLWCWLTEYRTLKTWSHGTSRKHIHAVQTYWHQLFHGTVSSQNRFDLGEHLWAMKTKTYILNHFVIHKKIESHDKELIYCLLFQESHNLMF